MSLPTMVLELFLGGVLGVAGGELPRILGGFLGQLDDAFADLLAGGMGEHDGAEHDVFLKLIGFGFDHHHRVERAGDDQVEVAFLTWVVVGLRIYSPST